MINQKQMNDVQLKDIHADEILFSDVSNRIVRAKAMFKTETSTVRNVLVSL
jgi:hypothetical protein